MTQDSGPPPGGGPGELRTIPREVADAIEPEVARALGVAPLRFDGDTLLVAATAGSESTVAGALELIIDRPVRAVAVEPAEIERVQLAAFGEAAHAPESSLPQPADRSEPTAHGAGAADAAERYRELAASLDLPFVSLRPHRDREGGRVDPVDHEAARLLGPEFCRAAGLIPIARSGGSFALATGNPENEESVRAAAALAGHRAWILVASPHEIAAAIDRVEDAGGWTVPAAAAAPDQPMGIPAAAPGVPLDLAQMLIERGAVEPGDIEEALALQRSYGGELGEILTHNGMADERVVARALAEQRRITFTDPASLEVDPAAAGLLDEHLARRFRVAPLAVAAGTLIVATASPLGEQENAVLAEHFGGPVRAFLAPASAVDSLLTNLHAPVAIEKASNELRNAKPEDSASVVLSKGQKVTFAVLAVLALISLVIQPLNTLILFNVIAIIIYTAVIVYRFRLVTWSLSHEMTLPVTQAEVAALDETTLPVYTILVPLYKEPELVGDLVQGLAKLDYPKTKLDIKILMEADDELTPAAFDRADPPPHFQKVIVPDSIPKTKPKACNFGLLSARGEFVVIYDAEDQPEPDQLKKAIVAFAKAPEDVVCLQCQLNYFNQRQTLLTRWFTSEYSMWFDLMLPGLDASGVPIPLGGTSNHFRIEGLVESGAWDPFNVTEDADLGVRLHKRGLRTDILDSTTYEEATAQVGNWIRQRSRWVKGYIQTWLVQMRRPVRLIREIGLKSWLSFQLTVGGTFIVFLLNPVYWLLTTAWLATEAGVIESAFPSFLYYAGGFGFYFGNFFLAYMFAAGTSRRGYHDLVKYALFVPIYWLLMSVAAWKGFIQLLYKPFYWEKTQHGLFQGD
jgi:cellulose synthase/poly-beta-1,6-N-acetylglucosamine synthase-like glycosyltransferase